MILQYLKNAQAVVDFVNTFDTEFAEKLRSFLIDNADISVKLLERFPEKVIDLEIWDEEYVKEIAYRNYNREFIDRHLDEIMDSAAYTLMNWREYFYREDNAELVMRAIDMVEDKYPEEKKYKSQGSAMQKKG